MVGHNCVIGRNCLLVANTGISGSVTVGDNVIFGGKAAPGYFMAKRMIKLITAVGATVNNDPDVNRYMRVVFLPNFNVKNAHLVYPAANLSEQISTAGKEASGTGNMKFMINGALTIGTLDGANVEIRQLVGDDNFFLFGMTEPEVEQLRAEGYQPTSYYRSNDRLRATIDLLAGGHFTRGDRAASAQVVDNLLTQDPFMALADFQGYLDAQDRVDTVYRDTDAWTRSAILNVARSGFFSSDRSMRDYLDRIWNA